MLLAINIGNTNISFGLFKNNRLERKFIVGTESYHFKKLKNNLKNININKCIVCSVVPAITRILVKDLKHIIIKKPIIVGKDIIVPIKNLYRHPEKLGQDRLVNAYAGTYLYGAPCIIVDLGTAITFDIVSKDKAYLGGMILPGLNMCLDLLFKGTALLPKIELKKPKEFIGQDTESSVLSGLIYGFAVLIDGMIDKIKRHLKYNLKVIGTGGDVSLIHSYSHKIDIIDRDLTIKGLNILYKLKFEV
jgi:type III pantothenate kinase